MRLSDYPPDWKHHSMRTKREAGFACENCGHPDDYDSGHILTVHHLDSDRTNNRPDNLVALCQRCHLSIQAHFTPGQLHLPQIEPPRWYRRTQQFDQRPFDERHRIAEIDTASW